MDEQREWPIYALANYDNAGRLLDLCRAHLAPAVSPSRLAGERRRQRRRAAPAKSSKSASQNNCTTTTTSGYHTTTEESAGFASKKAPRCVGGAGGERAPPPPLQLEWRHLIQAEARRGATSSARELNRELERLYRARLVRLCAQVKRAVSDAAVAPEPAVVGRAGQPLGAGQHERQAAAAEAAQLRRLGWRRRRVQQLGRPSVREIATAAEPAGRHLAARTFSVIEDDSMTSSGGSAAARARRANGAPAASKPEQQKGAEHEDGGARTRLERWLGPSATTIGKAAPSSWPQPLGELEFGRHSRGRYGESLVHIMLIQHSNEHLILLLILLHLWPQLLFDSFQSLKFKHLNCLHLTISHLNATLLEHLVGRARQLDARAAEQLIERRVSGSLFEPPLEEMRAGRRRRAPTAAREQFWCDKLEHWPTANGARHLILHDRFRAAAAAPEVVGENCEQQDGAIYFGQTPLAWAVSFKSRQMFELLAGASARANVNSTDLSGNSCLHQLVLNNQRGWTRFLLRHRASLSARNSLGLTPFQLACQLGRCELFVEFLELSAVEFWCYSSVRCCGYPLAELDSLAAAAGGQMGLKSAVAVILESKRSTNEEKAALLSTNVVKKLLEEKWQVFARRLFYRDLFTLLLQLALMLVAALLRPARARQQQRDEATQTTQLDVGEQRWWQRALGALALGWPPISDQQALVRHACELAIAAIALGRLWSFASEWRRYRNLTLQLTYNPLAGNAALANALVLACLPLRLAALCLPGNSGASVWWRARLDQLEDVLLVVASPLLWSSLLFFVAKLTALTSSAFYVTGPFVAMINYMLMRDLRQFSLIYLIFLHAFAQCIFFVNHNQQQAAMGANETANVGRSEPAPPSAELELLLDWLARLAAKYVELWLELFKMTLGVYEFQPFRHSILSRLLLMLFMHLIPILFNMLIAMMNNTYSLIISQSERAWSFQWAKTLFALERRLNDAERLFYLKKYAINLSSSIKSGTGDEEAGESGAEQENAKRDDSTARIAEEQFVPGLMIIKRSHCTRAEMRRKLIGHWQKSIRRVLDELKEAREFKLANC